MPACGCIVYLLIACAVADHEPQSGNTAARCMRACFLTSMCAFVWAHMRIFDGKKAYSPHILLVRG